MVAPHEHRKGEVGPGFHPRRVLNQVHVDDALVSRPDDNGVYRSANVAMNPFTSAPSTYAHYPFADQYRHG